MKPQNATTPACLARFSQSLPKGVAAIAPVFAAAFMALSPGSMRAQQPYPYYATVPSAPAAQVYVQQYAQPSYPAPGQAYAPQPYQQPAYPAQPQYPQAQPQYPQAQPQYPQAQPAYSDPYAPDTAAAPQMPAQPLDAGQLEQLVAPIALYPDTLVAQVLAAATYPAQVAAADQWRQALGGAYPDQIVAGANAQPWDPSVKALTAFPQVLAEMDRNLQWTTALGNAYFNQPQDVLQTVQVMRQRAEQAGSLVSTPQEAVYSSAGYVQIAPVNPAVVYVPSYNPWDVYGQPVQPYNGFSLLGTLGSIASSFAGSAGGSAGGSGPLSYGLGIAMQAFSHTPWGWAGWALNWLTNSVLFNHSTYASQSTTVAHWNLPPRTPRGWGGAGGSSAGGLRAGQTPMPVNRTPNGNAWAGNATMPSRPMPVTRPDARPYPMTRPQQQIAENRPVQMPNRNPLPTQRPAAAQANPVHPAFGNDYRPVQPAARPMAAFANRADMAYARQAEPARPGFGSGSSYMSRPADNYGYRPGANYASPAQSYRAPAMPAYRAPAMNNQRWNQPMGGTGAKEQKEFAKEQEKAQKQWARESRSGGFNGGGHGEFKAPKAPKAPKEHSSGGHGGGHSGGSHLFGGHH
jgi:hypothetical protein